MMNTERLNSEKLAADVRRKAGAAMDRAEDVIDDLESDAHEAVGRFRKGANRAITQADHQVHEHPWPFLMVVGLVGIAIGALSMRR